MKTDVSPLPRFAARCFALTFALLAPLAPAQTLVDQFTGTSIDTATWYPRATTGTVTVSDGKLRMTNGSTGSSQRAFVITQSSEMNPFVGALNLTFTGLTLSGTAVEPGGSVTESQAASWGNAFYAAVGRATGDLGTLDTTISGRYTAMGADYVTGLGLNIRQSYSAFTLSIVDRGLTNHTTQNFTLSGMPTDVVWNIDGTGTTRTWSVTLTNATFTASNSNTVSGTFVRFNQAELDANTDPLVNDYVSRLAFGAINVGNVQTITGVTLDSVALNIPEPSAYAALAGAFMGAFALARRRRVTS